MTDKDFACPEPGCEKVFRTEARLAAHRRMAPDHARPASAKAAAPAKRPLDPDGVLNLAVENLRNDGALLAATVAPYVGVAIHGNDDPRFGPLVKSRAVMAGNLLRERVRKDARLLRLLLAFNQLHEVPEGLQLAASMGVAIAVDTGRLAPDQEVAFTLMGREMKVKPAEMAIGDVLEYIAAQGGEQPASPPGQNGQLEPEIVAGGVTQT